MEIKLIDYLAGQIVSGYFFEASPDWIPTEKDKDNMANAAYSTAKYMIQTRQKYIEKDK